MGDGGGGIGEAGGGVGDGGGALGDGDGLGEACADAEGEGEGEGDAVGDAEGLGDDDGFGVALQAPCRYGSWGSVPLQPITIPEGCEYQSCMFAGRALTKRRMIVLPTLSPKAWIRPPPPAGAVFPTQTPVTMSGL